MIAKKIGKIKRGKIGSFNLKTSNILSKIISIDVVKQCGDCLNSFMLSIFGIFYICYH
jgi:hypothetical protein